MPVVSEPVSVIIIGESQASLTRAETFDNVPNHGGVVVCSCTGCPPTKRMLIDVSLAGSVQVMPRSDAGLKPAELHVINFPSREQANAWLEAEKDHLVGKIVYKLPQAQAPAAPAAPSVAPPPGP